MNLLQSKAIRTSGNRNWTFCNIIRTNCLISFELSSQEDKLITAITLHDQPIIRVSPKDLDKLMTALEVHFVSLTECSVSSGYALALNGVHAPGLHYNLMGRGKLFIFGSEPIELVPHTLII